MTAAGLTRDLWKRLTFGALLISSAAGASAPVVSSVQVRGTARTLELATREGEPLDGVTIEKDLRRLWNTGWFDDIRVERRDTDLGAELIFEVAEKERLYFRKVRFEPHSQERPLHLAPGSSIDRAAAQQIAGALRRQLFEEGYRDAKVRAELVPAGVRRADLVLHVERGEAPELREVRFTGELGLGEKDLRRALRATRTRTLIPGLWKARPAFSEQAVESDVARLHSLYLSRGYFNASTRVDRIEHAGHDAVVTYRIDSGPRYAVDKVEVAGSRETREIPAGAREFPARGFCGCALERRREAEKEGRIDFAVRLAAELAPGNHASVAATTDTGPPYTVGRIDFFGHHSWSDATLRRALVLEEGRPLDSDKLWRSLARLSRTGLIEPLSAADVAIGRNAPQGTANVKIQIRQKPRGRWYLSGPVGPPALAGPLRAAVSARLPGWLRGSLEASTYYASVNLIGFANPLFQLLPSAPRVGLLPLIAVERPPLPGQRWVSGFAVSPQLGLQGTAAVYGASQLRQLVRLAAAADVPGAPELLVTVETMRQDSREPTSAGYLICEPPKSRWSWLRMAATMAADLLLSASLV